MLAFCPAFVSGTVATDVLYNEAMVDPSLGYICRVVGRNMAQLVLGRNRIPRPMVCDTAMSGPRLVAGWWKSLRCRHSGRFQRGVIITKKTEEHHNIGVKYIHACLMICDQTRMLWVLSYPNITLDPFSPSPPCEQ